VYVIITRANAAPDLYQNRVTVACQLSFWTDVLITLV